ncbi:GNAT family N-acetyltransferase [Bacillus luteolus]|uniref:GNAT family N-acetyltransferase n=1 Tax=Litchfieldia luteola TaxID=682179 RepID=A0ABR9QKP5_9BACI|nr:GNAT family N-acetyltransferase [Cytobacillus luteolus]MBE4909075.1 GNAT family N-acetyltransferase [Cytobacillus luteolus]MBP1941931.1 ribosomal protein S18 acetylase RimI-like enzyme [Cytobacillus luteolus]
MEQKVVIEEVLVLDEYMGQLSELLVQVVEDGASIGFLPPLGMSEARAYWDGVLQTECILFIAKVGNEISGTVQLHLNMKANGCHRAEVAKLMTHPGFRRMGIGRQLMERLEEKAKSEGRSLLVLDTREGDPSNQLYRTMGYLEAGKIPNYAKSANGEFHATIFYYKELD